MEILLQFIYGAIVDLPPGANAGYRIQIMLGFLIYFFKCKRVTQNKSDLFFFSLFVSQSGGFSSRYARFGRTQRRGGNGSDQRLLSLLSQGLKYISSKQKCRNSSLDYTFYTYMYPQAHFYGQLFIFVSNIIVLFHCTIPAVLYGCIVMPVLFSFCSQLMEFSEQFSSVFHSLMP